MSNIVRFPCNRWRRQESAHLLCFSVTENDSKSKQRHALLAVDLAASGLDRSPFKTAQAWMYVNRQARIRVLPLTRIFLSCSSPFIKTFLCNSRSHLQYRREILPIAACEWGAGKAPSQRKRFNVNVPQGFHSDATTMKNSTLRTLCCLWL